MEIRIMPSNDQFAEIDFFSDWIARLKNNHLFWDLKDIPEAEKLACIAVFESRLEELSH